MKTIYFVLLLVLAQISFGQKYIELKKIDGERIVKIKMNNKITIGLTNGEELQGRVSMITTDSLNLKIKKHKHVLTESYAIKEISFIARNTNRSIMSKLGLAVVEGVICGIIGKACYPDNTKAAYALYMTTLVLSSGFTISSWEEKFVVNKKYIISVKE